MRVSVAAVLAAFLLLFGGAAGAADFYHGQQVTIVVGFTSAGTYDATARLFARHLGKYLPGKPTVIVRNMPGAGSLKAANYLADQADQAKAEIVANLVELKRPMAGLDMSVTTQVRYSATDTATGSVVFDDTVGATGTAKFGDSLIGVERLRLANEAAIKANIEAFIARLKEAMAAKRTASR